MPSVLENAVSVLLHLFFSSNVPGFRASCGGTFGGVFCAAPAWCVAPVERVFPVPYEFLLAFRRIQDVEHPRATAYSNRV